MLFVFNRRENANLLFHLHFTLMQYYLYQGHRQREDRGNVLPPKPVKFAKDRGQPTPNPAIRIYCRKKFKFSLNFFKFLLKFYL